MSDGRIVIDSIFDPSGANRGVDSLQKKFSQVGNKMKSTGESLSKYLTVPMAAAGAAGIATALDIGKSQTKIQNSLGLTEAKAKQLTNSAKNIYKSGFGESFEEVSASLIQTRQNIQGLNDEQLEKVTKSAMVLAETFDADVNEVTRAGSNVMKGFGVDSVKAFDLMAYGAQNGLNFSNEMFDNLSEYAPLFAKMGFSADEYFQLLVKGSKAGVYNLDYINDVMKEFQIRVKDGSKSTSEAMGQLSGKTQKVWKDFLSGKGTVKDVSNAVLGELKGMDDQVEANNIGVALFGTKWEDLEADAMYALGGIDGKIGDVSGTMDKMTQNAEESFSKRFTAVWRELLLALEPVGNVLLDLASNALPTITNAISFLTNAFSSLSPTMQYVVVGLGALLAAVGPLLVILGSLVNSVSALIPLFAGLSVPILPIVAAISALVAVGVLLWQNWETISQKAQEIWGAIWTYLQPVVQAIRDFIMQKFEEVRSWWMEIWPKLKEAFMNIWNAISAFITPIINAIVTLFKWAWPLIESIIVSVWENIKGVIDGALKIIMGIVEAFAALFTGDWKGLWEAVKKIISGALELIWNWVQLFGIGKLLKFFTGLASKLLSPIGKMWGDIKKVFSESLGKIWGWVKDKFQGIFNSISEKMTAAKTKVASVWNSVKEFFSSILGRIWQTVKDKFQGMVGSVGDKMGSVFSKVKSIWEKVTGFFKSIDLLQVGKDIINGLIKGISSMAGSLFKKAKDVADGVTKKIKKALHIASPSKIMIKVGKWTGEGIEIGLGDSEKGVLNAADKLAAAAMPQIPSFKDFSTDILSMPTWGGGQKSNDSGMAEAVRTLAKSIFERPLEIKIPTIQTDLVLNSQRFATATEKDMTKAQQRQSYRDRRRYK